MNEPKFHAPPVYADADGRRFILADPFVYETFVCRVGEKFTRGQELVVKGPTWKHTKKALGEWLSVFDGDLCAVEIHTIQIFVPAGFETDLASIPTFFHRVLPKSGLHNWGAIIHDYLYQSQIYSKEIADSIFYEAMILRGVPNWRAFSMYRAVQWFGAKAWNEHKAKKEASKTLEVT